MDHPSIAFPRPLLASVAVHVLLFGTALAFAHYGEVLFGGSSRVITVDLVGDGGAASSGRPGPVRAARAASLPVSAAPAMPDMRTEQDAASLAQPATTTVEDIAGRGADAGSGPQGGNAGPGEGKVTGAGTGNAGGASGLLSTEQWRMLQSALEKVKNYPRLARERGIEGTVLVRFRVQPSGEVKEVNVVRSSGADILDEASVRTVRKAAPMPYVDGWIEVPMVYELKREQ